MTESPVESLQATILFVTIAVCCFILRRQAVTLFKLEMRAIHMRLIQFAKENNRLNNREIRLLRESAFTLKRNAKLVSISFLVFVFFTNFIIRKSGFMPSHKQTRSFLNKFKAELTESEKQKFNSLSKDISHSIFKILFRSSPLGWLVLVLAVIAILLYLAYSKAKAFFGNTKVAPSKVAPAKVPGGSTPSPNNLGLWGSFTQAAASVGFFIIFSQPNSGLNGLRSDWVNLNEAAGVAQSKH